jgi:hypothetical protein
MDRQKPLQVTQMVDRLKTGLQLSAAEVPVSFGCYGDEAEKMVL